MSPTKFKKLNHSFLWRQREKRFIVFLLFTANAGSHRL